MKDISDLFHLDEIDHDELLKVFELRYETCWSVSKDLISFPASHDFRLQIKIRDGCIGKIFLGSSVSDTELNDLLCQIRIDCFAKNNVEIARDILFARRPVNGGFRFTTVPIQILPAPSEAPRPPQIYADHPFILEYPIRASSKLELRNWRRNKESIQWARVLNALLHTSITCSGPRVRQTWFTADQFREQCFWGRESYMIHGFEFFSSDLSTQSELSLPAVPAHAYYGRSDELLTLASNNIDLRDQFFIPNNLSDLVAAFLSLKGEKKRRLLRSAAAIYYAKGLWDVSISSSYLACVQAIEVLADKPTEKPCPTCGKNTADGPTQRVKKLIQKYCGEMQIKESVLLIRHGEVFMLRNAHVGLGSIF